MAEISVIVPVYNTEKILPRCMEGILAQTFSDIDVVLVNDGSRDNSPALCDDYAARDSRVHVIHQENAGVGAARNAGLDWVMANSGCRWICFVDSDDWIHPRMLEELHNAALAHGSKVSACGYLETEKDPLPEPGLRLPVEVWNIPEFYREQYILATVPWGKLYARSCFDTIRYPVGAFFDDEFVTYRILFAQETIPVVQGQLYAYYINTEGLTKKPWSPRRLEVWPAYEQQIAFFTERKDLQMVRFRYRHYLENIYGQLQAAQSAVNADQLKPQIRRIRKAMRAVIPRAWKAGEIRFWMDYDMLREYYPVLTKVYRLYLEWKEK